MRSGGGPKTMVEQLVGSLAGIGIDWERMAASNGTMRGRIKGTDSTTGQ